MTDDSGAGTLTRAHQALGYAGLTVDTLQDRLRAEYGAWRQKIVEALAGTRRFSSLTLAIFAEVTDADITWLLTGASHPGVSTDCVSDESVGAAGTTTAVLR